ncbi:uncharacterized protein LOC133518355 [Cydia pomonella]|uniref:uncharacterized protein LOC133518355 n=1 Tax=Cydia pomonella TaxID=82600 RepID=UPI002ADD47A6|nr:uncharacterized protein LOC133518355 [Cydia pomonella]
MSPLACCLVALAALFAVSHAKEIGIANPFCGGVSLGEYESMNTVSFKMTVSGGAVVITDKCPRNTKLVGQNLNVCNVAYSMPELHPYEFGLYPFEKVFIDCPKSTLGCDNLELHVTQYCRGILAGH